MDHFVRVGLQLFGSGLCGRDLFRMNQVGSQLPQEHLAMRRANPQLASAVSLYPPTPSPTDVNVCFITSIREPKILFAMRGGGVTFLFLHPQRQPQALEI